MPGMTGELLADFSDFQRAAQEATVALRGMETGGAKVETSLNAVADSLSGRTLIQNATLMVEAVERIGGASMLTGNELARVSAQAQEAADKLKALGQHVPEGIQRYADEAKNAEGATSGWSGALGNIGSVLAGFGLAVTTEAVIGMTKEIFASASALEKMHVQTGITVENMQRMQIVGDGVGVSLETMTKAATKLEAALGAGDQGTAGALHNLNIDLDHFKQLGAADRFEEVSKAVRTMEDPLKAAADLQALYGKGWAELFPALKVGFKDAGDDVTVMSSRTVQVLDDAGNAVGGFWRATKANLGEAFADILTLSTSEWRTLKSEIDHATEAATKMKVEGLTPVKDGLIDVSGAMTQLNAGLDDQKTKVDGDVAAQKRYNDAWVELNAAGDTWQGIVAAINTETAALAKHYLEAGVSQSAIATGLNLTNVEVKALATSVKAAEDAYKAWAATENKFAADALKHAQDLRASENKHGVDLLKDAETGYAQMKKVKDEYHDSVMKSSMDTSTYQITKIWEGANAQILAFKGGAEERAQYADLVYSLAEQEARGITDVMASAVDSMAGKAIEGIDKVKGEAQAAVSQMYSMSGGQKMSASDYDEYYKTPQGIADIIRNNGKRYYEGEVMPRDSGGSVSAGQPYLIGTGAQPELFVPSSSGTMYPNAGGGGPIHTVINITQPLGTPMAIAAAFEDAMTRTLRSRGVRLPSGT